VDQLWVFKAGEAVDFHGVQATWVAAMSPELMKGLVKDDFVPGEIHRETSIAPAITSRNPASNALATGGCR
jgi:hypothetical protein